ncbi:MAG: UDP-glucose/GDP-mannose dehydrogenase family protein [Flavobacteriaceae bacterium]|nr:UDP-glucose/GDP-mannose dehydrogenase family protein [Flavobacteriaceae bacterium]
MKNKITIIGSGYVGLVTGACFAEMGNKVTCVDIDTIKIKNLQKGIIPIYEPGLEALIATNYHNGNLKFTAHLESVIDHTDILFIAVGTPMNENGSADLKHVLTVAKEIGKLIQKPILIIDKSTVPVGTAEKVRQSIQTQLDKRKLTITFDVVSNPEFLKEGNAIADFMKPDRIIIGSENAQSIAILKSIYAPFFRTHDRFIIMDIKSAELTKYAANAMLATKISFMNEIANICELVGADVNKVRVGIGSDSRIGYNYIYPGAGFGGSCLPKDVNALAYTAKEYGYTPTLLKAVNTVNDNQKLVIAKKVIQRFGTNLTGKTFTIWGLAFKPGTDDMRQAPAIYTINELTKRGAKINAYDPKATQEAKTYYLKNNKHVSYFKDKYNALKKSDALLLLTEWKEFRSPNFDTIKDNLNQAIIFDGRNQYNAFHLDKNGFEYYQIGKK